MICWGLKRHSVWNNSRRWLVKIFSNATKLYLGEAKFLMSCQMDALAIAHVLWDWAKARMHCVGG